MREVTVDTTAAGVPFAVVDDFFNQYEADLILKELEFIRPHFEGPGGSNGAVNPDGSTKKNNNSLWLNEFFVNPNFSKIYELTRQFYDPDFIYALCKENWIFRHLFDVPVGDNIQLLYYEQSSTYDTHTDTAFLTYLYWTHKTPKKFDGGDIILEEDTKVEFKANRLLVFPSITPHRVTPVRMQEKADGYGRYCVSNFLHQHTLANIS